MPFPSSILAQCSCILTIHHTHSTYFIDQDQSKTFLFIMTAFSLFFFFVHIKKALFRKHDSKTTTKKTTKSIKHKQRNNINYTQKKCTYILYMSDLLVVYIYHYYSHHHHFYRRFHSLLVVLILTYSKDVYCTKGVNVD